jgi:hypothetical protein
MAKPEPKFHKEAPQKKEKDLRTATPQHQEPELKGTFASVMLLGLFLVLTWVGAYVLFISRM